MTCLENLEDIRIDDVKLALYGENPPGDVYTKYKNGRGTYGIVVVVGGKTEFAFSNSDVVVLTPGNVALFSDECAYTITNNESNPFCHYVINFTCSKKLTIDDGKMFISTDYIEKYADKCEKLFGYWKSGKPYAKLKCIALLYEIICEIIKEQVGESLGSDTYKHIMSALEYIDNHYCDKITIESLSKLCSMSKTNFRRLFTKLVSKPPNKYLMDVRITRAKEYLSESSRSVEEIASICGFGEASYFCKCFRKHAGMTPIHFRMLKGFR